MNLLIPWAYQSQESWPSVTELPANFRIGSGAVWQGRAMSQQLQSWQSKDGEKVWLSALVEAMEEVSHSGPREKCDDRAVLDAVSAQLARPAPPYLCKASNSIRLQSAV
jgi:hypothetical protein